MPVSQARENHGVEDGVEMKQDAAHPDCIPMQRMGTRATRASGHPFHEINPRLIVSKVIARQQGYLKGGLRRRCVESLTIPPFSQTGVLLCGTSLP